MSATEGPSTARHSQPALGGVDLLGLLRAAHLQRHDRSNLGRGVTLPSDVSKSLIPGRLSRCLGLVGVSVGLVLGSGAACQRQGAEDGGDQFHVIPFLI
jgi:hypothetical protein